VESSALLTWSTNDPEQLGRLFVGDDLLLSLAATPESPSGDQPATIATDWCEATIKYRRPADGHQLCF